MKYLSLFSGIEAFSQAVHDFGWTCVGVSEIDPFACEVLKQRLPTVQNLGDITKITKEKLNDLKKIYNGIDLVVGGSPCQSFSVAGLRKGLEDPRGNLMLEYVRVVATVRPSWFVWENVPGALSSGKGQDFGTLLQAMAQLGYSLGWRVLDAQHYGVPQRRRRVFLVGSLNKKDGPFKVLFERKSVKGNSNTSAKKGKSDSSKIERSVGKHGEAGRGESNEKVVYHSNHRGTPPKEHSTCPTLMAWMGTGGNNIPMKLEQSDQTVASSAWRITSWSSNSMKSSNPHSGINCVDVSHTLDTTSPCPSKNQGGICIVEQQVVAPKNNQKVMMFNPAQPNNDAIETDKSVSLIARMGTGGNQVPLIVEESKQKVTMLESNQNHATMGDMSVSPTLNAAMGQGGGHVPMVVQPSYYEHHPQDSRVKGPKDVGNAVTKKYGTGGGNVPLVVEQTLHESRKQRCGYDEKDVCPTLESAMGMGGGNIPLVVEKKQHETFRKSKNAQSRDDYETWVKDTKSNTLAAFVQQPNIAIIEHEMEHETCSTLCARDYKGPCADDFSSQSQKLVLEHEIDVAAPITKGNGECWENPNTFMSMPSTQGGQLGQGRLAVRIKSKVRKLTPVECERLQGFPDNYTQIPYRKKPAEKCPHSPRYKALGNSMAVPVMRWLACRIALVDGLLVPSFRPVVVEDKEHTQTFCVQGDIAEGKRMGQNGIGFKADISYTLQAHSGTTPAVVVEEES